MVTFNDVTTPGDCPAEYSVTRTWTATDASGNAATCSQTLTVEDKTAPTLAGVPADETIECGQAIPPAAAVTAEDSCDPNPIAVTLKETTTEGGCAGSYTLTRTWTATDACGNTASDIQEITVEDTTPPVLVGVPGPVTVECDAVPDGSGVTATDNCDPNPTVLFDDVRTEGTCPESYTITRTWTATDDCGKEATASQVITVQDTTAPTITCPGDEGFTTLAELNAYLAAYPDGSAAAIAQVTADDNCDDTVTVTSTGPQTDNGASDCGSDVRTITRTYRAADGCGNYAECTQTITLQIEPPACEITITAPAEICLHSTGNKASVVPVTGATYLWTIENGVITAGQGTDTITWTSGAPGETSIAVTVTAPASEGGCQSTCSEVVPISECTTCNTGFAYGGTNWKCFSSGGSNWGFYLELPKGSLSTLQNGLSADLIAGAAQCDISNGYNVGDVSISLEGTDQLTYDIVLSGEDCELTDYHVWVSNSPLPTSGGYNNWYHDAPGTITLTPALSNKKPIYVAVHAGVCCSTCADKEYCTYG